MSWPMMPGTLPLATCPSVTHCFRTAWACGEQVARAGPGRRDSGSSGGCRPVHRLCGHRLRRDPVAHRPGDDRRRLRGGIA